MEKALKKANSPAILATAAAILMLSAVIPLGFEYLLAGTEQEYLPFNEALNFETAQTWLHFATDFIIGLSYVSISTALIYLAYRARDDIPFMWMFIAFGAFIITCGFTHFTATWTLWAPAYYFAGGVKFITAIASVATAVVLPFIVPKALQLVHIARRSTERTKKIDTMTSELREKNTKLEESMSDITRINQQLSDQKEELEAAKDELEKVNALMVGRELKMQELKKELSQLKKKQKTN